MRAPKSPFERYLSKRILVFAYLMCSSVSGAKALKKRVCDLPCIQFKWKVTEHFWNRIKKMWIEHTKIALEKKVFWNKKFGDTFLLFICKTSYCRNLRAIEQIPFDFSSLRANAQKNRANRVHSLKPNPPSFSVHNIRF